MRPRAGQLIAAIAAGVAAVVAAAGCSAGPAGKPEFTIGFQAPAGGPLKMRTADMRRAAELELDAIHNHTKTARLRLSPGADPKAIATIGALTGTIQATPDQLIVNLTPPLRRNGEAPGAGQRDRGLPPEIWLLPPDQLARSATQNYRESGATAAVGARTDSPLRAGTPRGLYVTSGLSQHSYPPAGSAFFKKFVKQYGRAPDRYAIYGYEAIGLIVDAIHRVEAAGQPISQQSVAAAALAIRNRFGPAGHYDILPSGQSTLYIFEVRDGTGSNITAAPTGPAALIEALR